MLTIQITATVAEYYVCSAGRVERYPLRWHPARWYSSDLEVSKSLAKY